MKRFYKEAGILEAEGGYQVALDGKPLRTPAKHPLALPNRALAEAIAEEWRAQEDVIVPAAMPLTQLASTAVDRVAPQRNEMLDLVSAYAETDLLCYRADQPAELAARQARVWQPLLDWAALRYDARLAVTAGVVPMRQPPDATRALRSAVAALDDLTLTAVQNATAVSGSLILALALLEGRIDADQAFEASELDRSYQIEHWGEDAEAAAQRQALREDLRVTRRFLDYVAM